MNPEDIKTPCPKTKSGQHKWVKATDGVVCEHCLRKLADETL